MDAKKHPFCRSQASFGQSDLDSFRNFSGDTF